VAGVVLAVYIRRSMPTVTARRRVTAVTVSLGCILARDAESYKRPLLSDSVSISDSDRVRRCPSVRRSAVV